MSLYSFDTHFSYINWILFWQIDRALCGYVYFGFGSGSGSLRARPTGFFSDSSAVTRWNSASTFPWRKIDCLMICICLYFYICACVCFCVLTVNSPDLVKGHQPRALFCWKMEILSVPSVSMSALHDLAVLAPRVNPWRSNSSVPANTQSVRCTAKSCTFYLHYSTLQCDF